jgi:hypothetical protein
MKYLKVIFSLLVFLNAISLLAAKKFSERSHNTTPVNTLPSSWTTLDHQQPIYAYKKFDQLPDRKTYRNLTNKEQSARKKLIIE